MRKLLVILVAIKVDVQINISRYIKYCEKKSIDLEESDYRHDINDNLPKYEPKKIHFTKTIRDQTRAKSWKLL